MQKLQKAKKKAAKRNINLDELAREAGVGPGTLYRHFPTRDALLEAVYRRAKAGSCREMRCRFLRVDPDNRLVAASLKSEWNAKLPALSEAEQKTTSASA